MNVRFSAVEMFTLAQPRAIRSANCASVMPLPPCSAIGTSVASTMSLTRCASSFGSLAYIPCALPIAGANTSTPVERTNPTATSSACRSESSSEPTPSSTPLMPSISPSTWAP